MNALQALEYKVEVCRWRRIVAAHRAMLAQGRLLVATQKYRRACRRLRALKKR